ncbi:AAA family ATPase [Aquirhabdus sp.]|uniref:AAA family ATPase n=1 Tax=Aquirhabdus sp. TaxID=2824160 RepID=UPI00396C4B11
MYIKILKLKNWRNFREAEINMSLISYVIGPNASGKSNSLDVLRFMRDICKADGGGLQKAVKDRGNISKLRCLHSRQDTEIKLEFHFVDQPDDDLISWRYVLGFKAEGRGNHRILISTEEVWQGDTKLLSRPDDEDKVDRQLLTETALEQTRANKKFREVSDFFANITYLHLVPQLLKFGDVIGGNRIEGDPFGQGFLERIAKTPKRVRDSRLGKIALALSKAVPRFKELRFSQDEMGHPHLEALYEHYRPNAGWQREDTFSDGTLRLLGILWSLQDGSGLLLLEEPEISLNEGVIEQIPLLIDTIQRSNRKARRQIIITTHSQALLRNSGIDYRGVIVLEPQKEGTKARKIDEVEQVGLDAGLTIADVVLPKTRPETIEQMGLWE